jgi:hypothetical protein
VGPKTMNSAHTAEDAGKGPGFLSHHAGSRALLCRRWTVLSQSPPVYFSLLALHPDRYFTIWVGRLLLRALWCTEGQRAAGGGGGGRGGFLLARLSKY